VVGGVISGTGQVASFRGVLPNLDGSTGYRVAIGGVFAQALGERYLVELLGVGGATMGAFGIVGSKTIATIDFGSAATIVIGNLGSSGARAW
jgi:hypothetical protein